MKKEEFKIIAGALPPDVEWKRVKDGILIRSIRQPQLETLVKMPEDIADIVWDWLHNPRIFKDKREYLRVRSSLMKIMSVVTQITLQDGSSLGKEALLEFLKKQKSTNSTRERRVDKRSQ